MVDFLERIFGAAMLDADTYEDVEADKGAFGQAMAVVVLYVISASLGAVLRDGIEGMIVMGVVSLVGWFVWAFIIYIVGTKFLAEPQTESDMGELLRTIGFAASPGLLSFLGGVPFAGPLISFGIFIWMLAAMVIAVRQALDYESTGRAIVVCMIGWVVFVFSSLFLTVIISAALMMA